MEPTKLVPGSSFVFYTSGSQALKKSVLRAGQLPLRAAAASNEKPKPRRRQISFGILDHFEV